MKRFSLLFRNELKLFRTAIPVHIIAVLQPTVMFVLMSTILVHPTFDMFMTQPSTPEALALATAIEEVGSPIGMPYIKLHLVENTEPSAGQRQVVSVETQDGRSAAVQRFGLIDSNMVKNFRNRLTAAGLRLWNESLGEQAVTLIERPWLPRDVAYLVYFGMAMLPISAAVGASILGGILMAQEFEGGTILEMRLSPVSAALILGTRITRLTLFGLLGVGCTFLALGWQTGYWPESLWRVIVILLPVAIIYGCVGLIAGLHFQRTIPSFLIGLVASMVGWLLGCAFGLAGGFSPAYEWISHLTPNTHAVELLFPQYFGTQVGIPFVSALALAGMTVLMVVLTGAMYLRKVLRQG
jgi:hypothetical protein